MAAPAPPLASDAMYLTLPQVADALTRAGIPTSRASAYRLAKMPSFPALVIRGRLFCRRTDLFAWIDNQSADSGLRS
ncbi:helix-turn-helix domain-containing protein [Skermanella pratensis]|uniref:helix-turn-helix domain-containing protein n=1 Tax=Skermanella pratensis TaxID=2233999 RepID=UPI001301494B|nr:helix-turn-helix domain-containing protein [Skermanella pratensis]